VKPVGTGRGRVKGVPLRNGSPLWEKGGTPVLLGDTSAKHIWGLAKKKQKTQLVDGKQGEGEKEFREKTPRNVVRIIGKGRKTFIGKGRWGKKGRGETDSLEWSTIIR